MAKPTRETEKQSRVAVEFFREIGEGPSTCMQLKMFNIPIKSVREAEAGMNGFLRGHRVRAVATPDESSGPHFSNYQFNQHYLMKKHSNKTFRRIALPALLLASAATAQAGPRTSASYTIAADTTDAGGKRTTSASYTNDGSAGGIAGLSTVAAPAETLKSGYAAQLYDVTGLTLTAASHVVHFDRWWNPAVEDQATDRAFRIGQKRNVLVHKFVCRGTVEERIDHMIHDKRQLAADLLDAAAPEVRLTELSDAELLRLVRLDLITATGAA